MSLVTPWELEVGFGQGELQEFGNRRNLEIGLGKGWNLLIYTLRVAKPALTGHIK